MSTPLTASYRIQFEYTVLTYPHKTRLYCKAFVDGSSAYGFSLTTQDGGTPTVVVEDATDGFWVSIRAAYKSGDTSFGNAVLQKLIAGSWVDEAVIPTILVATGSADTRIAGQITMTGRDTGLHHFKAVLLENAIGIPQKFTSISVGGVPGGLFTDFYTTQSLHPNRPGAWMCSRANLFVRNFVSATTDVNDKLRRGRRLQ